MSKRTTSKKATPATKGSAKADGLARIAKAIERIAICVERREERRDEAVSRISLAEAVKEVGIKVKAGPPNTDASGRILITPNVVMRAARIIAHTNGKP